MKVTLVTVVYNSQDTIGQCIDSVLTQDYENIEHVVVDGNSTDGTFSIIKSYNNIISISEKDNGIYDAINKGLSMATGDIVGLLHSDDILADNNVISRVVEVFKKDNLDCVYADVQFVSRLDEEKILRYYSSKYFRPWMFRFGFQPAHTSFYMKRDLLVRCGKYRTDLKIAGDFEFLLRAIKGNGVQYKYQEDLWVKMKVGGASTSGLKSIKILNREIIDALRLNGIYTNIILVYSKYIFKWWGFLFKKWY